MMGFMKGIIGCAILALLVTILPEGVSSNTVFLGVAIIIGGAVAYSGKD